MVIIGSGALGEKAILHGDLTTIAASVEQATIVIEGEIFNTATSYGDGINRSTRGIRPRRIGIFLPDPLGATGRSSALGADDGALAGRAGDPVPA